MYVHQAAGGALPPTTGEGFFRRAVVSALTSVGHARVPRAAPTSDLDNDSVSRVLPDGSPACTPPNGERDTPLRLRPGLFDPRSGTARILTPLITSVAALALLGGLAVRPEAVDLRAEPVGYDYDWYDETPAELLRQDQCLMADVLRLGGPAMAATAQDGLNQPADRLRVLADRQHWQDTPLSQAFAKDRADADKKLAAINALQESWKAPLAGLTAPVGMSDATFHWPPGTREGQSFYSQTGLSRWIADQFWKNESDFYQDATPQADEETRKAVIGVGTPLYGKDPDSSTSTDWSRDVSENDGFKWLTQGLPEPMGADNARLFLASGGFPRTAPEPGTAEFRIAVEDMKTRFSTCAWRDPIDPNKVRGPVSDTAAAEWQQEIASQSVQRNQVVNAGTEATKALAAGAESLGQMLGHSWVADHLTRWQDYWSPGGLGWIGNADATIELHAAKGKCLDVQGGGKNNGTPVQVYTCNGSAAQKWRLESGTGGLQLINVNSFKCLDVNGNNAANGTKIQIVTCNTTPAQTWDYTPRATTPLRNIGTGKCVNFPAYDLGKDAVLWDCNATGPQQFDIKPSGHKGTDSLSYPEKADFDQATKGITDARAGAKKQLALLKAQATAAKNAAAASDAALQAAYAIADKNGAPRGRGLLVGLQKAQVTKGAAAALDAMVKAGETAEAATRAAAGDSETITQRALAQAAQSKAEFRKEAARAAEQQAKAAADAARLHRDNAKKDKETAEAKLTEALKAEGDAKAAAADAHAKRLAAEAEEATAKAEKETAAVKQAEAAQHKTNAETQATKAEEAKRAAEASEATAVEKKNAAVKARDKAKAKRDDAWEAEQRADAAAAKAAAKEAYAQAHESDSNAKESREAADQASAHADSAEAAARKARGEADLATDAAAAADAAATRAEAAAKRARADADGAQAAKLKADAALRTATSAAADAIVASQDAAAEARTAVELADEAEVKAKDAKKQAETAGKEAANARAAAAKAVGFAHVTAQAAADAGSSAAQVAKPANDAIQLGSPYVTTDSTAPLVVLTGQASKTIAEQQKAVADAHAKNAKEEAAAAKALADAAAGDAKQAYQHAANAAGHAADARGYAKEALGYAADAATAAAKAAASLARTTEYDRQAAADAVAADKAAGRAEGHARSARESADQAALDAEGARRAATRAEQAAKDARAAANRADAAATEAERAAKDAEKYAKEAQEAAERAERKGKNDQIRNGVTTGVPNLFYVVDRMEPVGEPEIKKQDNCGPIWHTGDCVITAVLHFDAYIDLYLCTEGTEEFPAQEFGCPQEFAIYLGAQVLKNQKQEVTRTLTMAEFNSGINPTQIIFGDFIECAKKIAPGGEAGSWAACGWAATWFIPGKAFKAVGDALHALNASLHTGVGVREAFNTLRSLEGVDPATLARVEETVHAYEDVFAACERNSFPGETQVLMADGSHRAIRAVRVGDRVLATDPSTGGLRAQEVTALFRHETEHLVDITTAGGRLTSTIGHRFFVIGRGWTTVADLRVRDRLRTPEGKEQIVTALQDRAGLAPRMVFDLTVEGLHTFYVRPHGERTRDLLVHNCTDIIADEGLLEAHTLREHVDKSNAGMQLKADTSRGGIAGRWTSKDKAAAAVKQAIEEWIKQPGNAQKMADWRNKQAKNKQVFYAERDCLLIQWQLRNEGSLGQVWRKGGSANSPEAAGNTVRILLRYVPKSEGKHPERYVVFTSYPLPQ
ncbi:ricin-type beta-trefoil lectin domain protein [Streptomyces sp. NPDC046275]|uniref:RICIN domain-containing protein n=1 Tax=Streptomyces sp. NPDC046275 TaxID=3157201 RepID=UPI0033EA6D25